MAVQKPVFKQLAYGISGLSSPYLVTTLGALRVIIHHAPNLASGFTWSFYFLGTVLGLPLIYIVQGMRRKTITDIHVALQSQRQGPIIAAITGGFICTYIFRTIDIPKALFELSIIVTIGGIAFLIATQYLKVSFHVGTFLSAVAFLTRLVHPAYAWLTLVLPIIMWARWYRGRHTIAQSMAGALLSVGATLGAFFLFDNL